MTSDDHAVIVGISHYPGLGDLLGPREDATHFKRWLLRKNGGNVPKSQIYYLTSPNAPGTTRVTRAYPKMSDVDTIFEELCDREDPEQGSTPIGRRLYIFMAGHGFAPQPDEAALLMANAKIGRYHHVGGRWYGRYMRYGALFQEVVVLMDCCRTLLPNVTIREPGWKPNTSRYGEDVQLICGFAAPAGREAREGWSREHGVVMGYFTQALLAGFRYAWRDGRGRLTVADLEDYIKLFLSNCHPNGEYPAPHFSGEPRFSGELVFLERGRADRTRVRISFDRARPGENVHILDSGLAVVAQTTVGAAVWEIKLPAGMYRAQVTTDAGRFEQFKVLGGEPLDVRC